MTAASRPIAFMLLSLPLFLSNCTVQTLSDKVDTDSIMTTEIPGKTIFIEQIEDMFEHVQSSTEWDIRGPMLWGYFFVDSDRERLKVAAQALKEDGYRFVDIYQPDIENRGDADEYWLHVEKAESHTPKSLDKRNDELYLFAHSHGLVRYDGMDVGPIDNR